MTIEDTINYVVLPFLQLIAVGIVCGVIFKIGYEMGREKERDELTFSFRVNDDEKLAALKQELQDAVNEDDFETAARCRDQINAIQESNNKSKINQTS